MSFNLRQHSAPWAHTKGAEQLRSLNLLYQPRHIQSKQAATLEEVTTRSPLPIPPLLKNNVAVLEAPNPTAPGGVTHVYLLGMSHVSRESCDQVRELIHHVRPEVVMVELCKDRVPLLIGEEEPPLMKDTWHSRRVKVEGVPSEPGWPQPAVLRGLLKSQPGRPVSVQDIEEDVNTLLSTGLFLRVRPQCEASDGSDPPQFLLPADLGVDKMKVVPPLKSIRFLVTPRVLPAISQVSLRLDSSMKGQEQAVDIAVLTEKCQKIMLQPPKAPAAAEGTPAQQVSSLPQYLEARQVVQEAFGSEHDVVVIFRGVESGRVEVLVRTRRAGDPVYLSGLENSAEGGEGMNIEPFRPLKPPIKLSPRMAITTGTLQAWSERQQQIERTAPSQEAEGLTSKGPRRKGPPRSEFRLWSEEEVEAAPANTLPSEPVVDVFGRIMTGAYAKYQAAAGQRVGVSPGEAWRVAMQAACEVGSQQLLLGDRPTSVSQKRLAKAMLSACGARVLGGLVSLLAGVAAAATHIVPDLAAEGVLVATGALGGVALIWPVVDPFLKVKELAGRTKEEIEEIVRVKEPLQCEDLTLPYKLWGEDALLDWPGAISPLLYERDTFMARALAAAATSRPDKGLAPSLVLGASEDKSVWRYMVAASGPAGCSPPGQGDGCYQPLQGVSNVVGVVGAAHVRGICQNWELGLQDQGVEDLLTVE